jgi:pyridoxamine 5'-phosphate oxidase
VLLKAYDERGLVVFTNLTSRKAARRLANPRATLLLPWVRARAAGHRRGRGRAGRPGRDEAYFRSRPRGSQLGAWASRQSTVLPGREVLEQRQARWRSASPGRTSRCPDFWGGLRVVPTAVEFWQGPAEPAARPAALPAGRGRVGVERLSP